MILMLNSCANLKICLSLQIQIKTSFRESNFNITLRSNPTNTVIKVSQYMRFNVMITVTPIRKEVTNNIKYYFCLDKEITQCCFGTTLNYNRLVQVVALFYSLVLGRLKTVCYGSVKLISNLNYAWRNLYLKQVIFYRLSPVMKITFSISDWISKNKNHGVFFLLQ